MQNKMYAGGVAVSVNLYPEAPIETSSEYREITGYYATPAEAFLHSSYNEEGVYELVSDEILRFEDEDSITALFFTKLRVGYLQITAFSFDKQQGIVSTPVCALAIGLSPNPSGAPMSYRFDEHTAAASYIMDALLLNDAYSRATNGKWVSIGVSQSDAVYHMTILGQEPTGVERLEYDGEVYYLWYYLDDDISQALLDGGVFKSSIQTYGDIVDALNIQVEEAFSAE